MRRVLVVDSDPRVCQAIHKTLLVISCTVFFAFDAVTAITEARRHNPDLIIVDLSLPAGSGLLVVERLRALSAFVRTPMIVIAERGARLEADRVLNAGANAFLPKPLNLQVLLSQVATLLAPDEHHVVWRESVQVLLK